MSCASLANQRRRPATEPRQPAAARPATPAASPELTVACHLAGHPPGVSSGPADILALQRTVGNRAVQQLLGGPLQRDGPTASTAAQEAAERERLNQLTVDGVLAFEELARYWPSVGEETSPTIPGETPEGLRKPFGLLREAKQQRFGVGLRSAEKAVGERLQKQGPAGFLAAFLHGPQLILKERLDRQYAAKRAWQQARPVIVALVRRYKEMEGANAAYAAELQGLIQHLDRQMTALIPRLELEMAALTTPDQLALLRSMAEIKQAVDGVDGFVEAARRSIKAVGKSLSAAKKAAPSLGGDEGSRYGDLMGAYGEPFAAGVKRLEKLKAAVGLYNSPEELAKTLSEITSEGASIAKKAKGGADIAKTLLEQVKDVAPIVIEGVAKVYDGYANRVGELAKHNPDLAFRAPMIMERATWLRQAAAKLKGLKGLELATGMLGIVSGSLGLVEGIQENEFETAAVGALDVGEGLVAVVGGSAAAGATAPAFLSTRALVHVVAETGRMGQAIRNYEMKQVLAGIEDHLKTALKHATAYATAEKRAYAYRLSGDAVDAALADQYQEKAIEQVAPLHNAIGWILTSAVRGKVSRYPVLVDAFEMAFGGRAQVESAMGELVAKAKATEARDLAAHAQFLNSLLDELDSAIDGLNVTMTALDEERDTVRFSQVSRNRLTIKHGIGFSSSGHATITSRLNNVELEGPVKTATYQEWLAGKLRGKRFDHLSGITLVIEATVAAETVALTGRDGKLRSSEGLGDAALAAIGRAAAKRGDPPAVSTADEAAAALWRLEMRHGRVDADETFA